MAIASPTHISRQSAKQISSKPDKQASPNMTNVPASMAFGVIQPCATARSGPNPVSYTHLAYNYLVSQVDNVVNKMEARTMEFMDLLNEPAN